MTIKQRIKELFDTIYPYPVWVGDRTYFTTGLYLIGGFIMVLISLGLDYLTNNHEAFSVNLKLALISVGLIILYLISRMLINRGVRTLSNRLLPYFLLLINHVILLYLFANSISFQNIHVLMYVLLFSFGYIILNGIYQMFVLDYYRGKKGKVNAQKNMLYIPALALCMISAGISIFGTMTNDDYPFLFCYACVVMSTVMYQLVAPEFYVALNGEKYYHEAQKEVENRARYSHSVADLLKNGGKK